MRSRSKVSQRATILAVAVVIAIALSLLIKSGRVVNASTPALGDPIANLTSLELQIFNQGETVYTKTWDPRSGLGPVYTQDNCTNCHASPIAGGGGSSLNNVDTIFATVDSQGQFDPMDGSDANDTTNEGGILLQPQSISSFVPNCSYPGEVIPTTPQFPVAATLFEQRFAPPNFGMGLIDAIAAADIQAQAVVKGSHGEILGQVNSVPDEYGKITVGRFGFKAQYATLTQFIGHAMTLELGVTNPVPNAQTEQESNGQEFPPCILAGNKNKPNDIDGTSLITIFHYLTYLAPNVAQSCTSQQCTDGQSLFTTVGCNNCHLTPDEGYTTAANIRVPETWNANSPCGGNTKCIRSQALSQQPVPLYSDLLLHDLGVGTAKGHLGDGFCSPQPSADCPFGQASGNQFRTTPLWGLSLRKLYLHDGRTGDLTTAIEDHALSTDSEAVYVVNAFNNLGQQQKDDLLFFLNTL